MTGRNLPELQEIRNNRPVDWDSYPDFLYLLTQSLLLALNEQGKLGGRQLRYAMERLDVQRHVLREKE